MVAVLVHLQPEVRHVTIIAQTERLGLAATMAGVKSN
jgi:hypothetical protein